MNSKAIKHNVSLGHLQRVLRWSSSDNFLKVSYSQGWLHEAIYDQTMTESEVAKSETTQQSLRPTKVSRKQCGVVEKLPRVQLLALTSWSHVGFLQNLHKHIGRTRSASPAKNSSAIGSLCMRAVFDSNMVTCRTRMWMAMKKKTYHFANLNRTES